MVDLGTTIDNMELNIRWIEDIPAHQFPGWGNVTAAMRDAIALLKEQELVRCKDCEHGQPHDGLYLCNKGVNWMQYKKPDWYCADGERK